MIFDLLPLSVPIWLTLVGALLSPAIFRKSGPGDRRGWALSLIPLLCFVYFAWGILQTSDEKIWRGTIEWATALGVDWDLWMSPLGGLMGLLVTGIGFLVFVYANGYLEEATEKGRLFSMLFLFMAAMLGLCVTENLIVFFLFWEMTSIASFLLIGFYHSKVESRKSALDALLITAGGGLALLAGFLIIGEIGGSYQIGELTENREAIITHRLYPVAFLCVLAGAVTKSAQFPFHFWLPGAMAAPAPVSAYLHSATMVKAGVFLLALLHPVLGGTPWWHFSLMTIGAVTMVWTALVAVVQTDLKRLLAFTTTSALGTLVMLLGTEHTLAAKAAVLFLIVHAFYKAALFMLAGIVEKATGTREIGQLRGLIQTMPILGIAAGFAALSMSGIPPFIGFIAKELLYQVKLETPLVGWGLLVCGFLASAANIVVAAKVGIAPFLGRQPDSFEPKKRPGPALSLGLVVLAIGSLALGLFPQLLLGGVLAGAVSQIQTEPITIKLYLWHGFNLVLLLSISTIVTGIAGYFLRRRFTTWALRLKALFGWSGQTVFRNLLQTAVTGTGAITRTIQNGNLRTYLMVIFSSGTILIFWAFVQSQYQFTIPAFENLRIDVTVVALLIAVAAVALPSAPARMTAILLLGCVGFGISALFALYGAPDLAITQLLVETLTLVLFAVAIRGLPRLDGPEHASRDKGPAVVIGTFVGIAFTLLTLKALDLQIHKPVSLEMAARSLSEAFGRNVVNVILVDFRALDTLGEICVLAIAALGVAAMLKRSGETRLPNSPPGPSAVLLASAKFTAPAMIVFSVYLLLRGHNEPGGGFIGGLVAAMAAVLSTIAKPQRALVLFGLLPTPLIAIGILVAALSGLPGLISGNEFFAAAWGGEISLPMIGKLKFGTPLLFDIGVYTAVAGVTLLLFEQFERYRNQHSLLSAHR